MTDHKFLKKHIAACALALERDDFKAFDAMKKGDKQFDKKFIYDYLNEDESDGKSLDGKALNKEYNGGVLDKTAY